MYWLVCVVICSISTFIIGRLLFVRCPEQIAWWPSALSYHHWIKICRNLQCGDVVYIDYAYKTLYLSAIEGHLVLWVISHVDTGMKNGSFVTVAHLYRPGYELIWTPIEHIVRVGRLPIEEMLLSSCSRIRETAMCQVKNET